MPVLKRQWTPHPAQRTIMASDARYRIAPCGRRFGKTLMARAEVVERAFHSPDTYVWWVAPNYGDANELGYDGIEEMLPERVIADKKRSEPRVIVLTNGTRISFRSADKMSSLRGRGLDFLVIDEAGEVPDEAWQAELRPSLSDTLGEMLAIGTPKGRNWFHSWFERGRDGEHPNTESFRYSTYENPHIPDSEVEDARSELPERVFKQEYLAQFMTDEGAVFGNVEDRNVRDYDLDRVTGEPPYTIGVDLARTQNYTVAIAVDSDGLTVGFKRMTGGSWGRIRQSLEAFASEHSPGTMYLDASRDNSVIEDLIGAVPEVGVERVKFTSTSKRDLIDNLAARLETTDIVFPHIDSLISELNAFQFETTKSGNVTYSAPANMNDDCVDALALAAKKPKVTSATW